MASEDDKCQALVKAEMRVSKAQDVREETELIMKPYANWEEYLMPAPLSVAILGQLIFISAGQGDFSINKHPPPNGFKYISYPESFRACLCQVSNEGWHAFNEAHVNMDRIRLLTARIPGRMKLIVQTLFQEEEVVNAMLPGQLKSMKSIVTECTTLAKKVKDKYKNVISLIQELLEACLNAKTGYEKELEEVQTALKQAKIREETAKKNMKMAEEYHNKMKKQTEDSFDQYKKAMDEVPSGWEAIGMTIVESLGNALTGIVNGIANFVQGKFGGSTKESPSDTPDAPNSESQSPLSAMAICSLSSMMLKYASGLKEKVVEQDRINLENVYDKRTEQVKTNWVKKAFFDLKNNIDKEENCQPKQKALNICIDGVDICEQLEHIATAAETGKEEGGDIVKKIEALYQQAAAFDSYSKRILKAPSFTPKAPNMAKYQQESTGGSVGVRNAHLKVEQSREMYKATQEEYQKSFENFKKQNEELAEILCLMEECKVKEIDFESALKMLREGLNTMGKVKEQWEKMIQFFEMISNIIDTCLSKTIHDFLEFVSDAQQIKGYSSMSYVKDTVYNQVFSASNVSHLVHMIAETYTEVSDKYLMDRISSLGRLITLEPTDPEFNSERNALNQGCEEARQAIYNMVIEKKEEFDRNLEARMKTIDREIRAALPPISVAEEKMIEKAVQDGRKELTVLEEDQFV
ncbi:PREDICTED: uncharacterized protein LOC107110555 [Gekko japonicus]|uniref:Uncharacterized protein LOC107110555 n=1 Tax=Gekko japonicus TaxID=146911 RepID=A0ABM1JZF2_GEKJA|nr:PREDICTED: uncharacterized protein LOC107110555 [Gekko japonicus]